MDEKPTEKENQMDATEEKKQTTPLRHETIRKQTTEQNTAN